MRSSAAGVSVLALALALLGAQSIATAAPRPTVALVLSSSVGPFVTAAKVIEDTLRKSPLQPEILTFDLAGESTNASAVLALVHRASPALIITVGSLATATVLGERSPAPVVFSMTLYAAQSGFGAGNGREVTGATLDVPLDVQFGTLRRLLPGARRLGVLYHPAETGAIVEAGRAAAQRHQFSLEARRVDGPGDAPAALDELMEKVDAVWTVADGHVFTPETTSAMILASLRRRIPLFGLSAAHVRSGALAALSCDYADVGAQAGELALRVLGGEKASGIPPTPPRKTALALNLRSAQHLGLTIDPALEREAQEVFR